MKRCLISFFLLFWATLSNAGDVTVAVASNFLGTAEKLAVLFEAESGHQVVLSHGSTGQLFSQIDLGAPFDIYLAGDAERPALLDQNGKASQTRTFAFGRLWLVSNAPLTLENAAEALVGKTVALADPIVAPYGLSLIHI